jgi:hypothetical protein
MPSLLLRSIHPSPLHHPGDGICSTPNCEKKSSADCTARYRGGFGSHCQRPMYRLKVAASIEEYKPWFHDLRGETRVGLGRSLC